MENTPGVLVRVPDFGNTSSIEYLDPSLSHPGQYFAPFVQSLVDKFGYDRRMNIRAAPYDFRYGPGKNPKCSFYTGMMLSFFN